MKHYKTSFLQDTHSYLLNPFDPSRYQQGKRQAVCSIFRNERPGSAEELSMIVHPNWTPHKYIEWSSESSWSFWNRWWIKPYHWTVILGPIGVYHQLKVSLQGLWYLDSTTAPTVDSFLAPGQKHAMKLNPRRMVIHMFQTRSTLLVLGFNQAPNHIVYCNKLQYVLVCYIYLIWFHM